MRILEGIDKPHQIFAEVVEDEAIEQFRSAMMLDTVVQGALMPDAHSGYTLPIGAVVAVKDFIYPSFVGYDIGCGMCAVETSFDPIWVKTHAKNIFDEIYKAIPVGFAHNKTDSVWNEACDHPRSQALKEIFQKNGLRQLGSLGGGNHFVEIGSDESGMVWIIIHSGSRGIGHAVASHYMRLASGDWKVREGNFGLADNSEDGINYIIDMDFCLAFALQNRLEIARRVATVLESFCDGEARWGKLINRNHNHADYYEGLWIHRKGATHAENGMPGVIPGNMRDGSFIVVGKGNKESLCSSSHGAGRVLGRKEASRTLSLDDFAREMGGVIARVSPDTLDESPLAYKSIFEVMEQQRDLVDIVAHVKPIINIKG